MNDEPVIVVTEEAICADMPEGSGSPPAGHDAESRTLLDAMPVGAGWFDREGRCAFVNGAFVDLFGYTLDDVSDTEQCFMKIYPDSVVREIVAGWCAEQGASLQSDAAIPPVSLDITCKDGTVKQVVFIARPALGRLIVTFTDRSELEQSKRVQSENRGMFQASLEAARAATLEREKAELAFHAAADMLQKTFASLTEVVFIVQSDTRVIVDANDAAAMIFGYSRDEIVGCHASCLYLNEQMYLCFCSEMVAAYQAKGYYETTSQMVRKDGVLFDSEHCVTPIRDNNGVIVSHVCVVRDVTERRLSEQALVDKSRLLNELNESLEARIAQAVEGLHQKDDILACQSRLLVDLAPEAIIVFDPQLDRIIDANSKAEQLFGCNREILLTSSPLQFYMQRQPDGQPVGVSFSENCERVIAGEVFVIDRAIRSVSGNEVVCEVRLVSLPSPHRVLIRASFFDITERVRTQKELTKALASEHRLNEEQRQFMGLVSHELRTPLSIIDGTAQLLALTTCKNKEHLVHAERILSSTKRLSSLIDTCLTEERLCTSGWIPAIVSVDIRRLARNVIVQAQTGTDQHLILSDLDGLPDQYDCDPMLIQVMLNNLLDNAIKYSPEGGKISVRGWCCTEGELLFEVVDQGIGIAPDQLEKAFDRFYRIWQVPGIAGAGLGLHIVKRIAELHGGTARCSSEPGRGSTFTVQLGNKNGL